MAMHAVRLVNELTRKPIMRVDGEKLIIDAAPNQFAVRRSLNGDTCSVNFARSVAMSSIGPILIVTPSYIHASPLLRATIEPTSTECNPTVPGGPCANSTFAVSSETVIHEVTPDDIIVPSNASAFELVGASTENSCRREQPRCRDKPMRLGERVVGDEIDEDMNDVDHEAPIAESMIPRSYDGYYKGDSSMIGTLSLALRPIGSVASTSSNVINVAADAVRNVANAAVDAATSIVRPVIEQPIALLNEIPRAIGLTSSSSNDADVQSTDRLRPPPRLYSDTLPQTYNEPLGDVGSEADLLGAVAAIDNNDILDPIVLRRMDDFAMDYKNEYEE